MATKKIEGSARERLLAAANELFYAEGIHTVGIDRVIAHAGVAKASLYSTFGSKEELVRAYLQARADARHGRIEARIAALTDPREQILAIFDVQAEIVSAPNWRGCPFVNASAEGARESRVAEVCAGSRTWLRDLFARLAEAAGADDPDRLARRLVMLYDGAAVAAGMDRTLEASADARAMAEAQLPAPGGKKQARVQG
ncbi:MAG: Transcriptional regulator, TetR family protein [Cyanobacteria bacterium RYN_339]|nr:Transcriptional regulator, TetR family protein [Cyanobacteria bacterium RYN_339]